jgi:hypothetical protein
LRVTFAALAAALLLLLHAYVGVARGARPSAVRISASGTLFGAERDHEPHTAGGQHAAASSWRAAAPALGSRSWLPRSLAAVIGGPSRRRLQALPADPEASELAPSPPVRVDSCVSM